MELKQWLRRWGEMIPAVAERSSSITVGKTDEACLSDKQTSFSWLALPENFF